jgi:hypothetical protein
MFDEPTIFAIDSGPTTCGAVLYHPIASRVLWAANKLPVEDAVELARAKARDGLLVAIERVQSQGQAGASLLRTSEVVGRLQQAALVGCDDAVLRGRPPVLLYRSEVLRALDVTGRGNRDKMVRARLIELHGGSKEAAVGRKATPGPLYGVAGHAWQALGLAVAVLRGLS